MNILLTGASGFLGKSIHEYIDGDIITLGRNKLNDTHIVSNLQFVPQLNKKFNIVIHNAGKAHIVPKNEKEKEAFYNVNFQGTKNLLEALSQSPPKQFVFISTIAVYGLEEGESISECKLPNPNTPYGKSKWLAEQAVNKWATEKKVNAIILRLPLVVGSNPPGNLGAIKKATQKGYYFKIKNNMARKSMVLAEDIAALLANLPADLSGTYNLTDGIHPTFKNVEESIEKRVHKKALELPPSIVRVMARIGDILQALSLPSPLNTDKFIKITSTLTFDDSKARKELNWNPKPVIPFIIEKL